MDIHVVMEGARLVGAATTPEFADEIRSTAAADLAKQRVRYNTDIMRNAIYNRMTVTTIELQGIDRSESEVI